MCATDRYTTHQNAGSMLSPLEQLRQTPSTIHTWPGLSPQSQRLSLASPLSGVACEGAMSPHGCGPMTPLGLTVKPPSSAVHTKALLVPKHLGTLAHRQLHVVLCHFTWRTLVTRRPIRQLNGRQSSIAGSRAALAQSDVNFRR